MATLITGDIQLPDNSDSFSDATVYVILEAIGMMDMPAEVIAQNTQNNVRYNGNPLSFSLDGTLADDSANFNLRVHISLHGSDDVQRGDFVTKRTYPVLKNKNPDQVSVKVEKV